MSAVVAVGSLRRPKLEAVRRALGRLAGIAPDLAAAEVQGFDAASVAPEMPLSLDALLEGSRARAHRALELAREHGRPALLGLGLEGGLEVRGTGSQRRAFLMSWAYASDGRFGSYGCGGAVELPPRLIEAVVDRGQELGAAIDAFSGERDVRSRQGAWGVLTRETVDRTASFETAVLGALVPFYNPTAWGTPPDA
jgi:non-canonical (house-cleaning) NTP pyrophosphatase